MQLLGCNVNWGAIKCAFDSNVLDPVLVSCSSAGSLVPVLVPC